MAKVKLHEDYEKMVGTPPPNGSRAYLTNRFGETIMSHYPEHKDPSTFTKAQVKENEILTRASKQAKIIMDDPVLLEQWRKKWYESLAIDAKRYKTLRGFVVAQMRKQLVEQQQSEQ